MANVELLLSCTRMYAQVSVFASTEGYYPDSVSVLADFCAKTCTYAYGRRCSTMVAHKLFLTNAYNEYMFCDSIAYGHARDSSGNQCTLPRTP